MLITCLGISGSGKTVFLGSLLDCLHSPANARGGFYIADKNARDGKVMTDTLLHQKIGLLPRLEDIGKDGFNGYPEPTSGTTFRGFSLIQGKDTVLDIGWLDYKGGLINGTVEDADAQRALYEGLDNSTAIVVFLDAYQIATATSVTQARRRVGADAISKILSHFETSKEDRIVNILIVLTQCDAIEDDHWVGLGDYSPLKKQAKDVLGGFIELVNRNVLWHCGMVAVSSVGVGRNRRVIISEATFNRPAETRDEIIDEPSPLNIVEAFYWLVGCEVATQRRFAQQRIAGLQRDRATEHQRVAAGAEIERQKVIKEEEERLSKLGFLRRLLETTVFDDDRLNRLVSTQSSRASSFEASQAKIVRSIEHNIDCENRTLLKFEGALQPLFSQSNNVVTKI
jgi:hypothetical protein